MSRALAYGFGLGLTLLVLSPALKHPTHDSFPISTFPMFAKKRDQPLFYFVEGVNRRGKARRLPPSVVANAEVMQAAARVRRAVAAGPEAAKRFCDHVAARATEIPGNDFVRVRIVGARFDPIGYFTKSPEPVERFEVVRCKVKE